MIKYKLVLFDLDGTLIDTDKLIFMSYLHVFKKYRPDYRVSFNEMLSFLGPTLMETFKVYFPNLNHDEIIEEYRKYTMENHFKFVSAFKDAEYVLKELKSLGVHIGIVTSKRKDVAIYGLKQFNLDQYVELLIDCNDVKKYKPDPEGVNKALEYFNVDKEDTLMVGDSQSDMLAGIYAGCKVAAVDYSIKGKFYIDLPVNYVIKELKDIIQIVKGE